MGAAELRAAVGELSADSLLASVAVETETNLWLPCDERGPIFCATAGQEKGEVATLLVGELRPVTMPALRFRRRRRSTCSPRSRRNCPGPAAIRSATGPRSSRFLIDLMARRQFVPHWTRPRAASPRAGGRWCRTVTRSTGSTLRQCHALFVPRDGGEYNRKPNRPRAAGRGLSRGGRRRAGAAMRGG